MTPPKKPPAASRKSSSGTKKLTAAQQSRYALLSSLVGRGNMIRRMAGSQYSGKRDIYATAGYVAQGQVEYSHYWGLYTRGDVAGRIVDMPAKTTWRTPPEITEEGKPDGTAFTEAFTVLAKRLRLWHYLNRADRLAGIGRYAVLMLGVRGTGGDTALRQPLETVRGPDDVQYLGLYSENNAKIEEWVTDPQDARFGLPKLYKLQVSSNQKGFKDSQLMVHASRCLHIAEDKLEDDVYGRPRLERVLNRLFDLDKVAASTGEAYWQSVVRILQAKIEPAAEITEPQLKELDEKLGEMVHDLRRQFTGQGVSLEWMPSDTPNVDQVADFYFSLIAGAAGIPKRILFGSELGELASTTDQSNYLGQINERQEQFAEPEILRALIDRLIALKALPEPETGEYAVVWPSLFEETEDAIASGNLKRAQVAQALTPVGGDPLSLVEIDEEGNVWLIPRKAGDDLPDDAGGGGDELEDDLDDDNVDDDDVDDDDVSNPTGTSTSDGGAGGGDDGGAAGGSGTS